MHLIESKLVNGSSDGAGVHNDDDDDEAVLVMMMMMMRRRRRRLWWKMTLCQYLCYYTSLVLSTFCRQVQPDRRIILHPSRAHVNLYRICSSMAAKELRSFLSYCVDQEATPQPDTTKIPGFRV